MHSTRCPAEPHGLAFVPIIEVHNAMQLLWGLVPPTAVPLLRYFDETYVTGTFVPPLPAPNARNIPPLFLPATWNVHFATLNGDARTNNAREGWNNRFMVNVGYTHPSTNKVIEAFKKDELEVRTVLECHDLGANLKTRTKRVYVNMHKRLHNLCEDFNNGQRDINNFLRAVGRNIKLTRTME